MAVLPTPASPIKTGLFFVFLESILITLRISLSLPITGSSLWFLASSTRSEPYFFKTSYVSSGFSFVTFVFPLTSFNFCKNIFFSILKSCNIFFILLSPQSNSASIICSTDTYSSCIFFAKLRASFKTLSNSRDIYILPLPLTFGSLSISLKVVFITSLEFTPIDLISSAISELSIVRSE